MGATFAHKPQRIITSKKRLALFNRHSDQFLVPFHKREGNIDAPEYTNQQTKQWLSLGELVTKEVVWEPTKSFRVHGVYSTSITSQKKRLMASITQSLLEPFNEDFKKNDPRYPREKCYRMQGCTCAQ